MDSNSDDERKESNPLPMHMVGHSRKTKGWGGQEMEMDHRLQQIRSSKEVGETVTAVDLKQFRNEEVGKGYQARGVVRQKMGNGAGQTMKIVDMTKKGEKESGKSSISSSGKHEKKEKSARREKRKRDKKESKDDESNKYLRCDGIRVFRREVEKIVVEAMSMTSRRRA